MGEHLPDAGVEPEEPRGSIELLKHRVENTAGCVHVAPALKNQTGHGSVASPRVSRRAAVKLPQMAKVLEPGAKPPQERSVPFTTISGRPIERVYTPEHIRELDPRRDLA